MAASIATELDQLKTALANAKAKVAADAKTITDQAAEITTLQGQVLDPTEAADLKSLAADALTSFPTPPPAS